MSSLLTPRRPPGATGGAADADGTARRPLALNAALATMAAVGAGQLLCWVVALVGWFASDGGAHGESTSALKVGSGAWLLAHGADLHLDTAVVTAVPLGLSLGCVAIAFRAAHWAGRSSDVDDLWSLAMATVVMGGTYGCLSLATAVLTTTSRAAVDPVSAFVGGGLLGGLAGAAGLVLGAGHRAELRALLPGHVRAVVFGALVASLSLWSAGAVLAAVAVAWRGEQVANVLARLHVDVAGGGFSLLMVALIAPNLAAWGSSYLLGGGFALGAGTVVSPSGVLVGPVPAVPVLAAVPDSGPGPGWAIAVLGVPVACGMLVGWSVTRRFPTAEARVAAARAAGAGLLGALALTAVAALSGGAVGGGRMTVLGPDLSTYLLMAVATLVLGATASALGLLWWRRRHGGPVDSDDTGLGLERQLPWRDRDAPRRRTGVRLPRPFAVGVPRLPRRRRSAEQVPRWALLGVWGASTPSPHAGRATDLPSQRGEAGSPDQEDTTRLSR